MTELTTQGHKNNVPPRPPDEAVAPPRRPRREFSFWPIELDLGHFSEGALARATRVTEAALHQDAKDEAPKRGNEDSSDYDYPGAHHQRANRVNVGQLWKKHRTFLAALPAYLQYGGRELTTVPNPGA